MYRITGIFQNTEDAQSAAKRINEGLENVYEIRLHYVTREKNMGTLNDIVYVSPTFSKAHSHNKTFDVYTDSTRESALQYDDICGLTVLAAEETSEKIQQIMHNENGYDVNVSHGGRLF